MSELPKRDERIAFHEALRPYCLPWAIDLADRGGRLVGAGDEILDLGPNDSAAHFAPKFASQEQIREYDAIFEDGAGINEFVDALQDTGTLDQLREAVLAGKKIAVISNHSTHIDPAIITNALYRGFNDPEISEKTAVVINVAMEYVTFAGQRIPKLLRKTSHVLQTAPDTDRGLLYFPDYLRQEVIRQYGEEFRGLSSGGIINVLSPSGTIDKPDEKNPNRRRMHLVKDGTITHLRQHDLAVLMALEVTQPEDKFNLKFKFGDLIEIPRGKDHPKQETRNFVHDSMQTIAAWNTELTNGSPEVFYEKPEVVDQDLTIKNVGAKALETSTLIQRYPE